MPPMLTALAAYEDNGFSGLLSTKYYLKRDGFDGHTAGKYLKDGDQRHRLFPHIETILQTADALEVKVSDLFSFED